MTGTRLVTTAMAWILLASLLCHPSRAGEAPDRPNILYIMSDDHAAHAIGAYGGRLSRAEPDAEH